MFDKYYYSDPRTAFNKDGSVYLLYVQKYNSFFEVYWFFKILFKNRVLWYLNSILQDSLSIFLNIKT